MSSPRVDCEVNTCTHWLPGELCGAKNIDILHEEEGRMSEKPDHTECKTFTERRGLANMIGSIDNVNWGGLASGLFKEGIQVTPSVTCIVNSCTFWEDGELCNADGIRVSGRGAKECQATNCETFTLNQIRD